MTGTATPKPALQLEAMLAEARQTTGLHDLGADWLLDSARVFVDSLNNEANLHESGRFIQHESIVRAFVNRLRMVDDLKRHSEIAEEPLYVAATIMGLPRTGTTMFQRLLSSVPGMNGARWWELQNFAPMAGEQRGESTQRLPFAERMVEAMLAATPELATIYPMSATQPDEEGILLHMMFAGQLEYTANIPSFLEWQRNNEPLDQIYADLRTTLQYLQWQQPQRREGRWILKAPEHMNATETLLDTFPEGRIVITHRDPAQCIGSLCSLLYTTQRFSTEQPDRLKIGAQVRRRQVTNLLNLTRLRERLGNSRFIDVYYTDLVKDPVGTARSVLAKLGIELDLAGEAAARQWLTENARELRAAHEYKLSDFGLDEDVLSADFADYKKRFLPSTASVSA